MNATTEGQKRAVLDLIYQAWVAKPELRLGQMLTAGLSRAGGARGAINELYNAQDFELVNDIKRACE